MLIIKGFIDIDSLSDFLESYNNYKKRPIQEAIFIALIKFFKDNYIRNEENLQRNLFLIHIIKQDYVNDLLIAIVGKQQ